MTDGEWSYVSNTNIFPRTVSAKRTDAEFRQKLHGSHHVVDSPLLKLDIDMIKDFPVADSLHLLHLGLMKRFLTGWRNGTFRNSDTKWPAETTIKVSDYLNQCKMPAEFHRVVRNLECLSHWKGTEFRTFLHYIGIVVLKDHLSREAYEHFLLMFCSVTICASKQYSRMLPVAHQMLLQFIEIFAELYGEHHITSNVHNLAHVVDDVERFGELESFSAYPFENQLRKIKRKLRTGNRPLTQVAKRIIEDFNCAMASETAIVKSEKAAILSKQNDGRNVPNSFKSSPTGEKYTFHSKVKLKEFCITIDTENRWFLTNENVIVCVINITLFAAQRMTSNYVVLKFVKKSSFSSFPLNQGI